MRPTVYRQSAEPKVEWRGTVERLAWGGVGVGRAEDGRLILLTAPLALFPGEQVIAQVRWKPRHGEGQVTGWTRRDPRRAEAGCPVASECGGCELWEAGSHAGELKRQMVADLLARQLPDAPDWRWLPAPHDVRRHRIQLHWDGKRLGFHRRNSHVLVPVRACPAAAGPLSAAIPRLLEALEARILPTRAQRWELGTGTPAGEVFASAEDGRNWQLEPDGWHPAPAAAGVAHRFGPVRLRHRPGGFFQVCPPWAWSAFGEILAAWPLPGGTLYDLYGGVGFFSALLAGRFRRRVLVENDEPAVAWAAANLAELVLEARCETADAVAWVSPGLGGADDLILLDPPRTGLAPELCERLQDAGAGALVLVGCDGAAFCRDLKRLAPAWRVAELAVADLFPLTSHVEAVALLRKG